MSDGMMKHRECAVCDITLHPDTEGDLCPEHEAWHNGWHHVPQMEQLLLDVWNGNRTDWYFGVQSHSAMLLENPVAARMQRVRYPLWVTVFDLDRRAKLWLDGGDQGWGQGAA